MRLPTAVVEAAIYETLLRQTALRARWRALGDQPFQVVDLITVGEMDQLFSKERPLI